MRIAVVGAGAFGAWTALWLRRRGADVTLIDQYGPGSSLATSGDESRVTRSAHGPDGHYPIWQRRALRHWTDLDDGLYVPTGVLWLVGSEDGGEAAAMATLGGLGIPVERLEVDEMGRRWPQIDLEGIDLVAANRLTRQALVAVGEKRLGYALVCAAKPIEGNA